MRRQMQEVCKVYGIEDTYTKHWGIESGKYIHLLYMDRRTREMLGDRTAS